MNNYINPVQEIKNILTQNGAQKNVMFNMIDLIAENFLTADLSNGNLLQNIFKIAEDVSQIIFFDSAGDDLSKDDISKDDLSKDDLLKDNLFQNTLEISSDSLNNIEQEVSFDFATNGSGDPNSLNISFEMEKHNENQNEDDLPIPETSSQCIICLENIKIRYVLVSCGHTNVCELCIPKCNSKCPTCRHKIDRHIKLYNI